MMKMFEVRNLLYRRSCQYTQSGLVDASVLEADLVERVKSFAKRYPNSRTAQACKAVEGCTPDAIAEAIRSTCQQARRELLQEAMTGWSDASNEVTSFISMTLLGISSVYVNHEEKLKKKFEEIGLIVDSVQESKAIMWKAPYRPEIASADEIPVTVSDFLRNAQAEKLWQGREDFAIDGRKFTAVHPRRGPEDQRGARSRAELTADRFVSRNKLKKASRMQKKAGGKDGKEIKIIIKSRFTRKEMEGLCNGGNTSIARVKRVLLEIANRLEIKVEGIDMEEDLNTKSWNGRSNQARSSHGPGGFDMEPEAAGQRGTSDAAQRQEESEGEWLEFTDLERITMEAASPSSQEDMQLVSELSAVIEDETGTSEPIKLVLDKAVGNLHDTFYSPGSLEFMSLGEWAKTPEEQGVGRNVLKP
ncbi:hypothetical protein GUITHDRAFT_119533 [Guillardia theta CCMP2712]|uniref:Uncharacterized protein n=1 Tax=Guillardia theta (strain CCMP2712) TaxID=905079 RepID=L1IDH8_GUITC|nr:hypothetical protein GUITHDRAFT_119533 [Guillardia theta CCMP2712]EKX34301.1 hypothetical protein GUITHDRAFT_119533 [Guillardia theta CCMP2712]|eukprot:XP_005821281.1 hypothetical protein GUITHDRAFT_119533 [Guillardia theta CCMP2712]